jgi:ABC-2 type transport system permease protein
MNFKETLVALYTLTDKEVTRFLRIWSQTLLPSVITTSLYFVIFGKFIGSQVDDINGVPYISFIVPGLVMLGVITNAFSNVVSSFFGAKFQRFVEETMVSPTPNWVVLLGYSSGGVLRGILVGILVLVVSLFFTDLQIYNLPILILFMVLTSVLLALGGFLNGLAATKFDDVSIFPTFILTPMTYLGGVFYSIKSLPPFWQEVSKINPVLYMVDGFRYGFFGFSDIDIRFSLFIILVFIGLLWWVALYMLNRGIGLKK